MGVGMRVERSLDWDGEEIMTLASLEGGAWRED